MVKAITRWWTNRNEKRMKEQLVLSKPVLDQLISMLEEDIQNELKALTSEKAFEYGSYNERIISKLGEIRAYRSIINMLKVEVIPDGR